MGKLVDLTNKRFGRLLVTKRVENDNRNKPQWLCECDCGNKIIVRSDDLKSGKTCSCGCLRKETMSKNGSLNKKYNDYKTYGNVVFVKFSNCNEYFLCDLEDWNKLKEYCWYKDKGGYAIARDNKTNNHIVMHRLIMDCPKDMIVDHKYRVSQGVLDNRKTNLVISNYLQNNQNRKVTSTNSTGITGVYWKKSLGKWFAQITVNYKVIFLGYFNFLEDAIKVRKQAELKYFGKYMNDSGLNII